MSKNSWQKPNKRSKVLGRISVTKRDLTSPADASTKAIKVAWQRPKKRREEFEGIGRPNVTFRGQRSVPRRRDTFGKQRGFQRHLLIPL